ncbi:MAG TPA: hypothetical protein PK405_06015, partial [Hyphomicrobiales bacterium]|nr:hypothetical protein [Hyphomicrobiales bacterium]
IRHALSRLRQIARMDPSRPAGGAMLDHLTAPSGIQFAGRNRGMAAAKTRERHFPVLRRILLGREMD